MGSGAHGARTRGVWYVLKRYVLYFRATSSILQWTANPSHPQRATILRSPISPLPLPPHLRFPIRAALLRSRVRVLHVYASTFA
eukprot:4500929-Pleurochrysis_carterae.AAC.1